MRAAALFAGATLALGLAAAGCGGGSTPPGALMIREARAERDTAPGAQRLVTTIRVTFAESVKPGSRLPLASAFTVQVPDLDEEGKTERVLVRTARVLPNNSRVVELQIDGLVPEGSKLVVAQQQLRPGAKGELTLEIESDVTAVQALLATRALVLTRAELVEGVQAPAPRPADRDPAAMRAALEAHLDRRGLTPEEKRLVLDRYESIPADVVTAPKLRAALAGLMGTFAQPAIDNLLGSQNCTGRPAQAIAFQTPPGFPRLAARVTRSGDGRRVISVNPSLEGERFELLMAVLAHEAVHCDNEDGRFEEIAVTALDTFLFMGFFVVDPGILDPPTPLARDYVVGTVAMINSGQAVPESIGLLRTPGVRQALPGTNSPHPSFADYVAASYSTIDRNDSAVEPLARAYAESIARANRFPVQNPFDLRYLDELLGRAMPPAAIVVIINELELEPE